MDRYNRVVIDIILISIVLLCLSCDNEVHFTTNCGTVMGRVILHENNQHEKEKHNDILVHIEGINPEQKAYTDESGLFQFDDVPTGTYNLSFIKEGFYEHKIISYQFIGGDSVNIIKPTLMYEKSSIKVQNLRVDGVEEFNDHTTLFTIRADLADKRTNDSNFFRYFVSADSNLSSANYEHTSYVINSSDLELDFKLALDSNLVKSKTGWYFIIYPSSNIYPYYVDSESGTRIYTSLGNASQVIQLN
ncbi:MAG: carboxypeptidase-like regulatory domain-containing protein [Marinifilaceae bacterium]|jgi:hypothetical protein|nr:carboxypeptidase-like regulatory domain-containing protein [Marinifilaceae bacterium]